MIGLCQETDNSDTCGQCMAALSPCSFGEKALFLAFGCVYTVVVYVRERDRKSVCSIISSSGHS